MMSDQLEARIRVLEAKCQTYHWENKALQQEVERLSQPAQVDDMQVQILEEIMKERERQQELWGDQHNSDERWTLVLSEETGEVSKSLIEQDGKNVDVELVQCAAVIVAWLEDRRTRAQPTV